MFEIIYRHRDFMVINKPAGLGMHQEGDECGLVTLLNRELNEDLYPVHRLDKVTSGVLLLARHLDAARALNEAFASQQVKKSYLALSDQKPKKKQGWIKGDMEKGRNGSWRLLRTQNNPASTYFDSYSLQPALRLYHLQPKTGKTHQLRVAMKSLGAPILGDDRYGGTAADRTYLHAWRIAFTLNGESFSFQAPLREGTLLLTAEVATVLSQLERE